MRLPIAATAAVLFACAASSAQTPAEADARAALALAATAPPPRAKAKCSDSCPCANLFGDCHCAPGKCPCCREEAAKPKPAAPCVCADNCKCESGKCPACPTAKPEPAGTLRTLSGRLIRLTPTGYVYADEAPAAAPAPYTGFPPVGGCAGGTCPTGRR